MKKMLAFVLALIMTLSLLPTAVWATQTNSLHWKYNMEDREWWTGTLSDSFGGSSWLHLATDENGTTLANDWVVLEYSSGIGTFSKADDGRLCWDHSGVRASASGTVTITSGEIIYTIPVQVGAPAIQVYTEKTDDVFSGALFANADNSFVYTSGEDVNLYFVANSENIKITGYDMIPNEWIDIAGDGKSATLTIPANASGRQEFQVFYKQTYMDGGQEASRDGDRYYVFLDTNDTSELYWNHNPQYDPWRNERLRTSFGGSSWLNLATDNNGTALTGTGWSATATAGVGSVEMMADGRLFWDRSQVRNSTGGVITITNGTISYKIPVEIGAPDIQVYTTKTGNVFSGAQFADADNSFAYTSGEDVAFYFVANSENIKITGYDMIPNEWIDIAGDGKSATLTIPASAFGRQEFLIKFEQSWDDRTDYRDTYYSFCDTNDTCELYWSYNPEYDGWWNERASQEPGGNSTLYLKTDSGTEIKGNGWSASISPANIGTVSMTNEGLSWDRSGVMASAIGTRGTITVSKGEDSYKIPVAIDTPAIWVCNTRTESNGEVTYSNPQFADAEWNYTYTSSTTEDVTIYLVAREDITITSIDGMAEIEDNGKSATLTIPANAYGYQVFWVEFEGNGWGNGSDFWFRDTNDEGTLFYRNFEWDNWSNQRSYTDVGQSSAYYLATDASGAPLDPNTEWVASVSDPSLGKVLIISGILYWNRSEAVPGAIGDITITNGTTTYRLPVAIEVPWMLMYKGDVAPENLANPDANGNYYYPIDKNNASVVTFVPSMSDWLVLEVSVPSDITATIADDHKSFTLEIPAGRRGNLSASVKIRGEYEDPEAGWWNYLSLNDEGAEFKLTPGKLIEESDFVEWARQDETFYVNENEAVPFTLSIDGNQQTFYMLPCLVNGGVLSSAWTNQISLTGYGNEGCLCYAVDYWTSENGGEDLTPISDELRGIINEMVKSSSITIAPIANYDGRWGTRFPSYATGEDLPKNIRDTLGNRLSQVCYSNNMDSLGSWRVTTTVEFKNGQVLTSQLSSTGLYFAEYSHQMEDNATVDDVNDFIENFSTYYPNANPKESQLTVHLPAKDFEGLIVASENAPAILMILGSEYGADETVLFGSICADNERTEVGSIRFVGAGKTSNEWKRNSGCVDELIGTPNYGIYGEAFGYIWNCSFSGYRTAVYSKADWYRFGMGNSIFYENHIALYMESLDPNGGGIPTMVGNVYMNNQFALWLENFPDFDTSTFSTEDNIFIDNKEDINTTNRSFFAPNNAFGTYSSNGNKAVPNTTGKAHAAPYYGVKQECLDVLSGDLSTLPLNTLSQELARWIVKDKKLYPKNWAVPSYGDAEIYMISVDDITDGMTISTIDNTATGSDDVVGTIKLKKNNNA